MHHRRIKISHKPESIQMKSSMTFIRGNKYKENDNLKENDGGTSSLYTVV